MEGFFCVTAVGGLYIWRGLFSEFYGISVVCGFFLHPTGILSLSKKPRESNHFQVSLQRKHFLLSYLNTLSIVLASVLISRAPAQ